MKPEVKYRKRNYLSVSTLLSFDRCPRLYFYNKCGLSQPTKPLQPIYGSAMHKAVPAALVTLDIDLAMEAFMSLWDAIELEIADGTRDRSDKVHEMHNAKCAERSLKHFIHNHSNNRSLYELLPRPEGSAPADDDTSEFEVEWAMDIGLPIPLGGRFDGFCRHRDTGERFIWEFKTASRIGSAFFEAHELGCQNITYCLAGRTLVNEPIAGVMVEGMLKSKTKVEGMSWPIRVDSHHLEDQLQWLTETGKRLLACEAAMESNTDAQPFTKNFSMCTPLSHFYMSGFRCQFDQLCRPPDWRDMTMLYKIEPEHRFMEVTVDGIKKA